MYTAAYKILSVLLAFVALNCSGRITTLVYPTLHDKKYDSEFPYRDCSEQLEAIGESVKIVYSTATYRTYLFPEGSHVLPGSITMELLNGYYQKSLVAQSSVSGTATVIYFDGRRLALLTCAHVVEFQDTIFAFYPDVPFVQSVSILVRQTNFIRDLPEGGELEILAKDEKNDIALLGREFESVPPGPVPVFSYPMGKSKNLQWGTFIYIIGYPMGYKMITKGIVSSPNRDGRGSFLTDAPMNMGLSGGIILAILDGVPNFELVGIAKAVSASSEYVLVPEPSYDQTTPGSVPFKGEAFVTLKQSIRYGVTYAVSTEVIRDLVMVNRSRLEARGFHLNSFIQ